MSARCLLLCLLCVASTCAFAHKPVTVKAQYDYVVSADETERQAIAKALNQARLKAVADRFGTFVASNTSIKIANSNGDGSIDMSTLGNSDIAGEWVETTYENTERMMLDGQLVIRATIAGKARAIDVTVPKFEATVNRVLSDGSITPASDFKHRERFDISFVSPEDGFVAIYATDGINNAFRLLPQASANVAEPMKVTRGTNYRFFSDSNPVMTLDPGEQSAVLRISVLFSTKNKPFALPIDEMSLGEHGDVNGWLVTPQRYQSWLARMLKDNSTQRRDIYVSITR